MGNNYYIINSISGIWNSYGCPPTEGNSISLSIENVEDTTNTGSLMELVGFDNRPTTQDIGKLRESQIISECVVMLPMIKNHRQLYAPQETTESIGETVSDPCECVEDPCGHSTAWKWNNGYPDPDESEKYKDLYYSEVDDAWLFKIDENIIKKIIDLPGLFTVKTYGIQELKNRFFQRLDSGEINRNNNIVKLMENMLTYNFPPHLNWLRFRNIPPLVIYSIPLSMNLTKGDLSDIWQGKMPNPSLNPSSVSGSITHSLSNEEDFFAGYDLKNYKDIKMKIFKCKYRSDGDYYKLIHGKGTRRNSNKNWYGYNWPYDNCSIIEYLNVRQSERKSYASEIKKEKVLTEENG